MNDEPDVIVFRHQAGLPARVERHDGEAVLCRRGRMYVFDRFHVELLALAFNCKLVEAGRTEAVDPRRGANDLRVRA
jgi:hypothetical protein